MLRMEFRKISADDILDAQNSDILFKEYAAEAKIEQTPEIKPNREIYNRLEDDGIFDCVGCFDNDDLVGFITLITTVFPHYEEVMTTVESQFIFKEHRKNGSAKKLMDEAILVAKSKGSNAILMTAPIGGRLEKIAPSFGFIATNITFSKKI